MNSKIAILLLLTFTDADFERIVQGYTAHERYRVERQTSQAQTTISLTLENLAAPYHKEFQSSPEELARYRKILAEGFSFGAFDGEKLIGIALAEPHWWNKSLWVWEFHVDPAYQKQGIGRKLMEATTHKARTAGLRVVVCETQNTNVAAIQAYRSLGFEIEGIDLSYYSNHDMPDGEVAVFMKRQIEGSSQ